MTARPEDLAAFVAGELDDAAAEAMQRHLGNCGACQAELERLILEETVTHPDGRPPSRPTPDRVRAESPRPERPRRRWRTWAPIGLALAAAAVVAVLLLRPRSPDDIPPPPKQLALVDAVGPTRKIDARLTGADRHRPYSVERGAPEREDIPLAVLADLEQRGAWSDLVAAHALRGDLDGAHKALARVAPGPQRDADAAALALLQHRPDVALGHAAAALAAAPRLAPALWNDARARAELHLPISAAARFEELAKLGEPGWADDARAAAIRLRANFEERRTAWNAARELSIDANRLAAMDHAVARRFADLVIEAVHEAVRSSAGADAARFAPLARAIGDAGLIAAVERAASAGPERAAFAAEHARLAAAKDTPGAAWQALASRAAGGHRDIALGAATRAVDKLRSDQAIGEAAKLRDTDPWLGAWFDDRLAYAQIYYRRNMSAAERTLTAATSVCARDRMPVRCARLASSLAVVLAHRGRRDTALAQLQRAMDDARRAEDFNLDLDLLYIAGELSVGRDPRTVDRVVVAAAYLDERSLASPECRADLYRLDHLAVAALDLNRVAQARAYSDAADEATRGRCKHVGPRINGMLARARLLQHTGAADEAEVRKLAADLATMRDSTAGGLRALVDHAEGRMMIERDGAAGGAALRRAIAAGAARGADELATIARQLSLGVLAADAARRGDHTAAVAAIAEQLGLDAPRTCAVAIAGDARVAIVAIGPGAEVGGAYRVVRDRAVFPAEALVGDDLARMLRMCDVVDVYATGIYYGLPRILPRDVAWRYRSPFGGKPASPIGGGRLVITDVRPPASLDLPALLDAPDTSAATVLRGPAATPPAVLEKMADAGEIEIHAHGLVDVAEPSAASLVLSPTAAGDYALSGETVRAQTLRNRPLVLLAACHAGRVPTTDRPWGLADAFLAAGARTVIASADVLPDAGSARMFAELAAAARTSSAATALRKLRRAHPGQAWLDNLLIFE